MRNLPTLSCYLTCAASLTYWVQRTKDLHAAMSLKSWVPQLFKKWMFSYITWKSIIIFTATDSCTQPYKSELFDILKLHFNCIPSAKPRSSKLFILFKCSVKICRPMHYTLLQIPTYTTKVKVSLSRSNNHGSLQDDKPCKSLCHEA
jgi:hypothetical protein